MDYIAIKDALVALFHRHFPAYAISAEEYAKVGGRPGLEDYIYLDIRPAGSATVDAYRTDRQVLVDAVIHCRGESRLAYLAAAYQVDQAVRPMVQVGDRAITVPDLDSQVVDGLLHCVFTLSFRDGAEHHGGELAEELIIDNNIERM